MNNIRLDGKVTLLSPMSHIGESSGVDSYLSTDIIIGPDGKPVECAVYSGNAFRGQLRDMAASYMLDRLGGVKIPLESFHLLFSGGSLGGPQSIDIDQARQYRRYIPMLSVFGGGVGNQILAGKIKMGFMYPCVAECQRILPDDMKMDDAPSWRHWTFEKSFTRMDDTKNENLRKYMAGSENDGLLQAPKEEQKLLFADAKAKKKKTKEKKEPAQQMRYTVELLAAGAIMYQRIDLCDMTDIELGAFVSALVEFSKYPYIGGKSGTGHGLVDAEYTWKRAGEKESQGKFLSVSKDEFWLSRPAEEAKDQYDDFLASMYNQYLEDNDKELINLLGAGK